MPSSKKLRNIQSNFRTANLKQNFQGIQQNKADSFLPPSAAVDIINMHSTEEGSWSADKAGYSVVNASGTAYESGARIDGIHWYPDAASVDHLIIACNGKLKEVNTSTGAATDIDASAGFTVGNNVDFEVINYLLFSCDGAKAKPRKWDGTTAADSGGWPINDGSNTYSKPKFVETFQGRAVYANFQGGTGAASKYPSHLVIGDVNAPESFTFPATTAAHSFLGEIGPGNGQTITGIRKMSIPALDAQGNDEVLVVFKERSIYTISGRSAKAGDPDQFIISVINPQFGAFNNRSIIQVGNDLYAMNEYGIVSYTTSSQSGTIQPNPINSEFVNEIIGSLNYAQKHKCWAVHLPGRRELWLALPTGANTDCDTIIVYKYPDFNSEQGVPRWSRRNGFSPICGLLFQRDFYVGFANGKVGKMFASSKYDTMGIPWKYEYPYLDAGNPKQIKRLISGDADFKIRSDQTVYIQTIWKGGNNNDQTGRSYDLRTTISQAIYGQAIYGLSTYGSQEETTVQYSAFGNGKRIKHILSGVTTDSGPEFLGLTPIFEFGSISQHYN